MIENKGGEEERKAYQDQLQRMKEQRDREFQKKLKSISSAADANIAASSMGMDPYSGESSNTRDRLAHLKMRFDSALK